MTEQELSVIEETSADGETQTEEVVVHELATDSGEAKTKAPNKNLIFGVAGAILLLVAAGLTYYFFSENTPGGEIAAKVGSEKIMTATLDSEMAKLGLSDASAEISEDIKAEYRSQLLEELIGQKLILIEADKEKIKVGEDEIDEAVASIEASYGGAQGFDEALSDAGYTRESFKEDVRWQLITTALLEKKVPEDSVKEEDVRAFYDENKDLFGEEAAKRCSHILYASEDGEKASKALERIKAGEDFAEIAKAESTDTMTAVEGGDLGWPTTTYVPEFQAAVDQLEPGDEPIIVQSVYGYHIVKVTDKRDASQASYEDAREQALQELINSKRTDVYLGLLKDLRDTTKVEIYDEAVKQYMEKAATQPAAEDEALDIQVEPEADAEAE